MNTALPSPAQSAALLDAACRIVGTHGLSGLTLRPLAQALGVSVSVLSHRYGPRDAVISAVCAAAADADAAWMAGWRSLFEAGPCLPAGLAADLTEVLLDDLASSRRGLSLLFLELLQASSHDALLRPLAEAWCGRRAQFWNDLAARAGLDPALRACGWWHGYVMAELAYGLALNADAGYRLLRRLCLARLFGGGTAREPHGADAQLFQALTARLQRTPASTPADDSWPARAARACGILLAERGVGALTHRAIARDIGIAHATLSYRFPSQRDLVLAGLAFIVGHIRAAVDAGSIDELQRRRSANDGQRLDLARASVAVAIAAARMPELQADAADLRSRRGANLATVFHTYLPEVAGIDALCAQVVSVGLTGVINAAPPGEASEQAAAAAYAAAVRWLAAAS